MKFTPLLAAALLTGSTTAIGPATPDQPPRLKGKPEKMSNWKWPNPFTSSTVTKKYDPVCTVERIIAAQEYLLDDLSQNPPKGLLPYRDALKSVFGTRDYPGSWDGIDPHGYDRHILFMDYHLMPLKVREWIEDQERSDGPGKGLFAVYPRPLPGTRVLHTVKVPQESPVPKEWRENDDRRVALFAPGAIYETLPLWVADDSDCAEALSDLSRYSAKPKNGGVIAYPVKHTSPNRGANERDMEITIKAQVLTLKPGETEEVEPEAKKEEKIEKKEETKEEKVEEKEEDTKTEEKPTEKTEEKAEEKTEEKKEEAKVDEKDEL